MPLARCLRIAKAPIARPKKKQQQKSRVAGKEAGRYLQTDGIERDMRPRIWARASRVLRARCSRTPKAPFARPKKIETEKELQAIFVSEGKTY